MVQAILATLGEADNPDKVDCFTINKEQPLHLDINVDPDEVGLDNEEFQDEEDDEAEPEGNITLEDEEKLKATESLLLKVPIKSHIWPTHLLQLCYITNKIVSSPQQWKKFQKCAISKYYKKNSEHKDR